MEKRYQLNTKNREKKIEGDMNDEHCQKAEAAPPWQGEILLKALSLLGMSDWQAGRPAGCISPVSTRQSQNLQRQTQIPLTKHKEQRQQPRASDQRLRGLENLNTSLQSLPKKHSSFCFGKSEGKKMASHPSRCLSLALLRSRLSLLPQPLLQDTGTGFLGRRAVDELTRPPGQIIFFLLWRALLGVF